MSTEVIPEGYNRELLVAVSTLANTKAPDRAELCNMTLLPLVMDFEVSQTILPVSLDWIPENPLYFMEDIRDFRIQVNVPTKDKYLRTLESGNRLSTAKNRFEDWVKKVYAHSVNKIKPIYFNSGVELPLMIKFFGFSENGYPYYYDHFSFGHVCITSLCNYMNDYSMNRGGRVIFRSRGAGILGVCNKLGIAREDPINRYATCLDLRNIYREMVSMGFMEKYMGHDH